MMKYKATVSILVVSLLLISMAAACGRQKETGIDPITENTDGENGKDGSETIEDQGSADNGSAGVQEEYSGNKFLIEQKDADLLLSEALEGTGCKGVFDKTLETGDDGYYTYTVTGPEGKEVEERLAVNGFSGEVSVLRDGKTEDFSSFSYYDRSSAKDRDINWEGDFVLDDLKVSLIPADEESFEFSVTRKKDKLVSGVARIDGDGASYDSGDEKLEFKMLDGNMLQLTETGSLGISGQYKGAQE